MLSIDITDRQVKLVRGSAQGNKIKIEEVDFRDMEEGLISNGYISDVPMVAAEIIDIITSRNIKEKETIISVNSSAILYRELTLPKPKKISNTAAIEAMIGSNMGISNDYNISYTIVGETTDENDTPMIKVLATACPQRMVDGYVKLFTHMGLKLSAVNVSNNSISRLIQNTQKMSSAMPLMLVQVDNGFLNVNLYDEGVLTFSRYFHIDPMDYNGAPDYLNQAVNDNLFRMFQFFQQRKDMKPIKEIMFYGEISDFIALTNAVAPFNVPCHILSMPTNIATRADFDFTKYANAIGSLYKVNKELEHINLLHSTAAKEKQGLAPFFAGLGAAVLGSVAVVFIANMVVTMINDGIKADTSSVQAQISDPALQARLEALDEREKVLQNFVNYRNTIQNADDMFEFMPKATTDVMKMLREPFEAQEGVEDITPAEVRDALKGMVMVNNVEISGYTVKASFLATSEAQPSQYVRALEEQGYFTNININYSGYKVNRGAKNSSTNSNDGVIVEFNLTMNLQAGNDFKLGDDNASGFVDEQTGSTTTSTDDTTTSVEE
ncbi:MAG: pilus assembly protein PilM [Eubacterium sp.]|nr:pilus assembly protein PilM [Eubacterium sp.]